MDLNSLLDATVLSTDVPRENVIECLDFINSLKGVTPPSVSQPRDLAPIDTSQPLDLLDELHYSYQVAKRLLTDELAKGVHDTDEIRKNLTQISKFMESALKMQERLANLQQIQRFQEAVYSVLETISPELRVQVVNAMMSADL